MNNKYIKRIELLMKELTIKMQEFQNNYEKMVRSYKFIEEIMAIIYIF